MSSKKACGRKVHYTKPEAKEQVRVRPIKGSFYHCEHCGSYHITSQPKFYVPERVWRSLKRG